MKHFYSALTRIVFGCLCVSSASQALAAGPLAIQGAKIITVSGETIENGVVLMRDGRIEAVGADIDIPGEAFVIDGAGKVVMPGIIDTHNAAGMSQANEQASVVPFLSVVDSIDPIASYFEECRRNGITTASVVPGNSTLIGGKAAIVKTAGAYVNDMLVRRDSALKLSLRPTSGSRMSQMAQLRKELDAAKKALEKEAEKEAEEKAKAKEAAKKKDGEKKESDGKDGEESDDKDGEEEKKESGDEESKEGESKAATKGDSEEKPAEKKDEGLEALKLVVQGKLPVYIYCQVAMDVVAANKLVDDYKMDATYVLGQECYPAAKMLASKGVTVILDPTLVYWKTNPRTREDEKIELPKIYREAGVPFLFQVSDSGRRSTLGTSYFWYQAATAVKYGMSEQEALAALTLEPAKLLGLEDRLGSIEVGKEADLVVLTGEPLDISTWVETTIVDGEVVYRRDEDQKLKRLLSPEVE